VRCPAHNKYLKSQENKEAKTERISEAEVNVLKLAQGRLQLDEQQMASILVLTRSKL